MKTLLVIILFSIVVYVTSTTATYNVACFAESTLSQYRRLVAGDCEKLSKLLAPLNINVTLYDVTTNGNVTAALLSAATYPNMNMIIGSNTKLYNFVVELAPQFPQIWWVMNRIPTRLNNPVPSNTVWLEYHEPIPWFLKGVLAAKFSRKNNFVISIPRFEGLFIMPTNFYYAGLLYANPHAKLTAILDPNFGQFAHDVIQFAIQEVPNWKVFASFASWTYLPGNLSMFDKLEIGNTVSVNSPKDDKKVMLTPITLTTTILDLVPLWKLIVLNGKKGHDLTRYERVATHLGDNKLVTLSHISPLVSDKITKEVLSLKSRYLDHVDDTYPDLYCEDFIFRVMRQIFQVPNNCVDPTQIVEGQILHPNIPVVPFTPPSYSN